MTCEGDLLYRAIRPIPRGEEICISYVELTGTHAERRATLQAGYHFDIAAQVGPSWVTNPMHEPFTNAMGVHAYHAMLGTFCSGLRPYQNDICITSGAF